MSRVLRSLLVVGAIACLVWIYFAPHLTVHAMHRAAVRGDAAALARHVDFPAVREDLKAQFAEAAAARLGGDGSGGWRDVGAALATAAAAPAIDGLVSETSLGVLFAGRDIARTAFDPSPSPRASSGAPTANASAHAWNPTMAYADASTFTATFDLDGDPSRPVTLIFKRQRLLWWKLSAIRLPPRSR
ncbi:MAG: DUF2939 domain-containing protein [Pseudomonadota bacterium]